jgi:hypothetical protein
LAFYAAAQENLSANNIFLDSDQDGLSDAEEKSLGTDPKNKDTDADGYSDGIEVKTGYDPLKKAPGDKVVAESEKASVPPSATKIDEKNLTQAVSQKIAALSSENSAEGKTISQDDVQTLVNEALLANSKQEIQLPEIKKSDLKIQKQDYGKYSKEKAKEKRKEDFSNYLVTVLYIFSNNSPQPITSNTSLENVFGSVSQGIIQAITLHSPASLENLNESGKKIQAQLLEMEIPEELADTHIKIIQFARYSQEAEKFLSPNSEDPIADIANLSYLSGLVTEMTAFTNELETKFNEYGLTYDENIQKKLESFGVEVPKDVQTELEKSQAEK